MDRIVTTENSSEPSPVLRFGVYPKNPPNPKTPSSQFQIGNSSLNDSTLELKLDEALKELEKARNELLLAQQPQSQKVTTVHGNEQNAGTSNENSSRDGDRSRIHGDSVRTSNSDGQQELGGVTSDLATVDTKNPRIPNLGVERSQRIPAELMNDNLSTRTGNDVHASNLGNPSKLAGIWKNPQKPTVGGKPVNPRDNRCYASLSLTQFKEILG